VSNDARLFDAEPIGKVVSWEKGDPLISWSREKTEDPSKEPK
jgi:hypothetical protein